MIFDKPSGFLPIELVDDDVCVKDYASTKIKSFECDDDGEEAFHVCDLGDIVKKINRFRKNLPRVTPYYAVKCNPDKIVLKLLSILGVNFDCASKGEIQTILNMGISPDRIVYANPCKQTSHIKYARGKNVSLMTFDNETELTKIKHCHPNAQLLMRIKVDDSKSLFKLGCKFGVDYSKATSLITIARDFGLNLVGVSFHVGSGCYDESSFYDAVKVAHGIFNQASSLGYKFQILDVGGGFPGKEGEKVSFEEAAHSLSRGFTDFFPISSGVKIIAEPGRYIVTSAFTSFSNIISVRGIGLDNSERTQGEMKDLGYMYYLNDGLYGSFNSVLHDQANPVLYPLKTNDDDDECLYQCSVWGPTCDSIDCITDSVLLPKLTIGDWLCCDNMGAYTLSATTAFNGFQPPRVYYICQSKSLEDIAITQNTIVKKNMPCQEITRRASLDVTIGRSMAVKRLSI